jgi:exodeoxyribonuclease VIII
MADWAKADASDRNQLVEDWRSGKFTHVKSESTSETGVIAGQGLEPDNGMQIDENDDETTRYPVVRMPFRKQLLAQFTSDELRHHITRDEYEGISALEMDTDNSYVQNLLLAAENCEQVKVTTPKTCGAIPTPFAKCSARKSVTNSLWFSDSPESGRRLITLTAACW